MISDETKCSWCGNDLPESDEWIEYCPDTDCEYDGEKWRRAHYER